MGGDTVCVWWVKILCVCVVVGILCVCGEWRYCVCVMGGDTVCVCGGGDTVCVW